MKLLALLAGIALIGSSSVHASVISSNTVFDTSGPLYYYHFPRPTSSSGLTNNGNPTGFSNWGSSGINTGASLTIGFGLEVSMLVSGTTPGTNYPVRVASGTASLEGLISISLGSGYTPALGDSISPIKYGTRDGVLRKVSAPALAPGLAWEVHYLPHEFQLTVVSATNAPQLIVRPGSLPGLFEFEVHGIIGRTNVTAYSTNSVDWVPFYTNALPGGARMFAVQITNLPNATFKAYLLP